MTADADDPERSSGPAWDVVVAPGAVRSLDRLPEKVAAAVVEFITATLPTNPWRLSKPLRYELEGWRVARRGTTESPSSSMRRRLGSWWAASSTGATSTDRTESAAGSRGRNGRSQHGASDPFVLAVGRGCQVLPAGCPIVMARRRGKALPNRRKDSAV